MTEPQKTDHWASLASNLGAEPAPEEPKDGSPPKRRKPVVRQANGAAACRLHPLFRPAAKPAPAPRGRPSLCLGSIGGRLGNRTAATATAARRESPLRLPTSDRHSRREAHVTGGQRRREDIAEIEIAEAELAMPVWDDLEPSATEPESFEPQEALDIMDETADEFGDEESEEPAAAAESPASSRPASERQTEERRPRRRRRRRGRGRGREDASPAEARNMAVSPVTSRADEPTDEDAVSEEAWSPTSTSSAMQDLPKKIGPRASGRSAAGVAAAVVAAAAAIEIRVDESERREQGRRR